MNDQPVLQKMDNTTFKVDSMQPEIEAVIGDEKQKVFHPRIKLKKWNNESNFSVGTSQTNGTQKTTENTISYETKNEISRFYPLSPETLKFDATKIRLLNLESIPPERIGSIYELDRHVFWDKQTITLHNSDRTALMYYGQYPAEAYLDITKIDIPEMRVSSFPLQNDPMIMDETLKLIDIHYNPKRDDLAKIHESTKQAIKNVLKTYNVEIDGDHKLYFTKDGIKSKFFSTAFVGGHYYYYINLGLDYNLSHAYYRDDIPPRTQDASAIGLRAMNPDIPDFIVTEIIEEYAKLYGAQLEQSAFTEEERQILTKLDEEHSKPEWIRFSKRDIFELTAKGFDESGEGFEFEIELKTKPSSNIVPLTVQTKNLAFHYQPELTADQSRLESRPQNVIGSYAAYNETNAMGEYKGGKAFHIYRPWAVDATGKKVWCSFDPKWDGKTDLNITVPQDFLDSASYPVIVDPTFGYTTNGSSIEAATNDIIAVPANAAVGTLSHLSAASALVNTTTIKMALYNGSNKVVDTTEYTYTGVAAEQTWTTLPATATLSAISYNIAAWVVPGYTGHVYDTVSGAGLISSQTYVSGDHNFPSTVTFTTNDKKYSIYGTYKISGSTGVRTWDGTNWVYKPVKVWDGSTWVQKPLKRWDGSTWITSDT